MAILGYIGAGNLGDEAILSGTIKLLDAYGHAAVAISHRPEETRRRHGIRAVDWRDLPGVWRLISEVDAFFLGGGSLLQDRTSLRSLLYYTTVSLLAACRLPVIWWAMGVGPLERRLTRRLVRQAGRLARVVTVREEASRDLLGELGVPVTAVVRDPAFLLPVPRTTPPRVRRLLVLPRPVRGVDLFPWLARELLRFRQFGGEVWLAPLQAGVDTAVCEEICRAVPARCLAHPETWEEFSSVLASVDAVLSVRLHGLILAYLAGRPCLGVPYDPKVVAHAALLGLPLVPIGGALAELLWQATEEQLTPTDFAPAIRAAFEQHILPCLPS